ncbi:unnamed protein product [Moneuplotes crassus]|uniref:Uncharacterized protein n=2 Tax=Euplotes crassus TaxID=5936 RepID=A0AAD1XZB1_EUPCR|nr:unnamed protein product [Moneuplotes crassus]
MKLYLLCILVCAVLCQDFAKTPRKTSSGIEFSDSHELLRYMHIKQHKMEDHYIKQIGTVYIFYNENPKDAATRRNIEKWRAEVLTSIKETEKYIDVEEIIFDGDSYDNLFSFYETSGKELKDNPLVLIDEFDERVWVYKLSQTNKITERIKSILAEGVSYFNY